MNLKDREGNLFSAIRYLVLLNGVMILGLMLSIGFNYVLYQKITFSLPPDLRAGALIKPGEKYPEDVFAFSTTVFQSLNNWRTDGKKDYPTNIERLTPMMTPRFKRLVLDDLDNRDSKGELDGRTRRLSLPSNYVFDNDTVKVINSNEWVVKIPLEVEEFIDHEPVKSIEVLYAITVSSNRSRAQVQFV